MNLNPNGKSRLKRGWTALGAILLLALGLRMMLRERSDESGRVITVARAAAAVPSPATESAAEKARRAAIAALGPIKRRKGTNAADSYKRAMGLYAELTEAEKDILRQPRDKVDPKAAADFYAKIQPIMDLLRRARKADYADWGYGPVTVANFSAHGSQILAENSLARLAQWEASYRFQSDPDGAVADVAAMTALGRSGAESLIGLLVQESIKSDGIFLLAQNAGCVSSAAGSDIAFIVNPAAAQQSFQQGLNGEAAMIQALLDEYANPATRAAAEPYLRAEANAVNSTGGPTSPDGVAAQLQWLIQTEQALAAAATGPQAQIQQWWNQKIAEAASMPAATAAIPGLTKSIAYLQMSVVRSAIVSAGMALEQGNQAQFQSIVDPSTGQPFTYTQTATGFQLGSATQYRGKPVSLSFSTPAAK